MLSVAVRCGSTRVLCEERCQTKLVPMYAPAIPWFVRFDGNVHVGLLGTHFDAMQWLSEVVVE